MLSQFLGEFFHHPAALDYSGNTCSNNCAYCFASIRTNERTANLRKLSDLCLGKSKGKGMVDWLFNYGYPICVSNRSDPFATSNIDNTGIALQLLDMVPNGVFFQTKGISNGVDPTILDGFKKQNVVMYITIDTMNDDICRRIEPGAPLPEARLELAKYAHDRGWHVLIGINPCWKPWLPVADFERLVERLDEIGVDGYFLQNLSLRKKDIDRMPPARAARLPISEIGKCLARDESDDACSYYVDLYYRLWDAKKKPWVCMSVLPTEEVEIVHQTLGKGVHSFNHFTNHCWEKCKADGKTVFTFDDFEAVMFDGNPEMRDLRDKTLYQYIMSVCPDEWRSNPVAKTARSFSDVYRAFWNSKRINLSPSNNGIYRVIVDRDKRPILDDFGNKQFYFCGRDKDCYNRGGDTVFVDDIREGKEVCHD